MDCHLLHAARSGEMSYLLTDTAERQAVLIDPRSRDRVFCGDLLAVDACPHQPHPAAPEALWDSVTQGVFLLPLDTLLFAGHERRARAVSTVLEQRLWHPLFAGLSRDRFLARAAALQPTAHGAE